MRIQTTDAVKRFNAQVEIADLALCNWPDFDRMSPERLHLQLLATGHGGLAFSLRECAAKVGYFAGHAAGAPQSALACPTKSPMSEARWLHSPSRTFAGLNLERDEMRTTLKQARATIIQLVKAMQGFKGADVVFARIEGSVSGTMDRIDSLIPKSEV